MNAVVVYDSAFGNTELVAQAIGHALGLLGQVQVARVGEVDPARLAGLTLLVVGSPTQKFRPLPAVSSWLKAIPAGGLDGVNVAAFDTRYPQHMIDEVRILAFFVRLFGYAARPIADRLVKKGGHLVVPPQAFYVGHTKGPLLEGELERAAGWARGVAAAP